MNYYYELVAKLITSEEYYFYSEVAEYETNKLPTILYEHEDYIYTDTNNALLLLDIENLTLLNSTDVDPITSVYEITFVEEYMYVSEK